MAVAYGLTSCSSGLVPKSWLLHSPEVPYGFVPSPAIMVAKTSPFGLKNRFSHQSHSFFSGAQRNGVFSSEDVLRCGAMWDDVGAGAGACSQAQSHDSGPEARRAKTSNEGFLRFLFTTGTLIR